MRLCSAALERLITCGVPRVLTSGGAATALQVPLRMLHAVSQSSTVILHCKGGGMRKEPRKAGGTVTNWSK